MSKSNKGGWKVRAEVDRTTTATHHPAGRTDEEGTPWEKVFRRQRRT